MWKFYLEPYERRKLYLKVLYHNVHPQQNKKTFYCRNYFMLFWDTFFYYDFHSVSSWYNFISITYVTLCFEHFPFSLARIAVCLELLEKSWAYLLTLHHKSCSMTFRARFNIFWIISSWSSTMRTYIQLCVKHVYYFSKIYIFQFDEQVNKRIRSFICFSLSLTTAPTSKSSSKKARKNICERVVLFYLIS